MTLENLLGEERVDTCPRVDVHLVRELQDVLHTDCLVRDVTHQLVFLSVNKSTISCNAKYSNDSNKKVALQNEIQGQRHNEVYSVR